MKNTTLLFSELALKHHILPNRLVVSPMCQYSAENGYASDWHLVHLGQFAIGRIGTIIQEATAVTPEGRISYGDLGLWEDGQIEKYRQIVNFIHSQGSKAGIQLAHAGRKASTDKPWLGREQFSPEHENGWTTVSSSAVPFHDKDFAPVALDKEGINTIIEAFRLSAKRAVKAGYDIIEVHAAHGYLIHQFLSPLVNQRTDEYGGNFENRIRLLLEIIQAVRTTLAHQSLWVRISATDWAEGGWNPEESVLLAKELKALGVEVIDVSSGGAVHYQKIPLQPGYQVPFAEQIKKATGMITGAVGLITGAEQAESILQERQADLIFLARHLLDDPHTAYHFAKELNQDLQWAPQYARAK